MLPRATDLSRDDLSNCSNLSRSSPWPLTGASGGDNGDRCLGMECMVGGGESKAGLKSSSSSSTTKRMLSNGEKGSTRSSDGGGGEMQIAGRIWTAIEVGINRFDGGGSRDKLKFVE